MLLFVKTSGDISHRVGNLGQTCCMLLKHLVFVKTSDDVSHRVGDLGQTCCCLFKHLVISSLSCIGFISIIYRMIYKPIRGPPGEEREAEHAPYMV